MRLGVINLGCTVCGWRWESDDPEVDDDQYDVVDGFITHLRGCGEDQRADEMSAWLSMAMMEWSI